MDIGIVVEGPPAQEQEVMESADHGAEDHGAEAGNHTHRQGAETHRPPCGGPRLKGHLADRFTVVLAEIRNGLDPCLARDAFWSCDGIENTRTRQGRRRWEQAA